MIASLAASLQESSQERIIRFVGNDSPGGAEATGASLRAAPRAELWNFLMRQGVREGAAAGADRAPGAVTAQAVERGIAPLSRLRCYSRDADGRPLTLAPAAMPLPANQPRFISIANSAGARDQ